jgi:ATP-dependent helicase/DNAse subunit B
LCNFAKWQADWCSQGWKIWRVEAAFSEPGFQINMDSGAIVLKGRIDRIDFNTQTAEYVILDFKSGDSSASASTAFSKSNGWLDLQLPVYFFYASEVLKLKDPKLAIVPISASSEIIATSFAKWDESMLTTARESMMIALKGIVAQEFWPPKINSDQAFELSSIYRTVL